MIFLSADLLQHFQTEANSAQQHFCKTKQAQQQQFFTKVGGVFNDLYHGINEVHFK